jgi:hypothetical protein
MVKSKKNLLLIILSVVFALTLISFVAVRPVKAESTSVVTMKETASIRFDTDGAKDEAGKEHLGKDCKNGLRFTAYLSEDVTLDEDTYAGIFVARGDVKAEDMKNLTPDNNDVINVKAERFDRLKDTVLGKAFNAVIYDIPAEAYTQDLTAMAYVCDNGEYSYSEKVCTRSLLEIASASLAKDNLDADLKAVCEGFIGDIKAEVKLGDTVLAHDSDNSVTLVGGETLAISVAPAGITYDASIVAGNALKLENGVVSVKSVQHPVQEILINVIGKEYHVNITTVADYSEVNGNVLATFDSADSIYSVYDGATGGYKDYINKSIEWLDPETAEAETGRKSGMLKVTALGSYDQISYKLPTPIKVSEFAGVYIDLKLPADMEWDDVGGIMYGVVNGKSVALGNSYYRTYKQGKGEWNTLHINYYDLKVGGKSFGLADDDYVEYFGFCPTGTTTETIYYIDEIGMVKSEGNVLVDFSAGFKERAKCVLDVVYPGDADYPDIGSNKPLLKVDKWQHAAEMELYATQMVKATDIATVTFKYWVPEGCEHIGDITMDYNLSMNPASIYEYDCKGGAHSAGSPVRGGWQTKTITPKLDGNFEKFDNGGNIIGTTPGAYLTSVYHMIRHWGSVDGKVVYYTDDAPWYMEPITFTKKA